MLVSAFVYSSMDHLIKHDISEESISSLALLQLLIENTIWIGNIRFGLAKQPV